MPNLYCNGCGATVSVADGSCSAGHPIRPVVFTSTPGRHRAKSRPTRPLERLALSTVKAISTLKPSEPIVLARRSNATPTSRATRPVAPTPTRTPKPTPATNKPGRPSASTMGAKATSPSGPSTKVEPVTQRPRSPIGSSPALSLPFVEMFGFDGDNEVLGEDEFLPIASAYAPSQVLQKVKPETETPVIASIKPAKISLFDAIPRLSEIGSMTSDENTGTLIERLWEATGEIDALEGSWNSGPTSLSARFQQTDRRWGLIGAAVVGLILLVLFIANLGSGPVASPELGPAREAVQAAADTIDDLTIISGSLADPAAPIDSISGAAVELAVIDRAARDLSTSASSLTSWEGYEDVASALSAAADQGSAIESRLGDALSYRLVSDTLFMLPAMPIEAEGALSAQLSFDLAAMVADAERAVARLPRDPALAPHRLESERLVDDMLPMIDQYLEALRNGDTAAAQTAAHGIIDRVTANQRTRIAGYESFDSEMRELADAYSARLQTAAVLLNELP